MILKEKNGITLIALVVTIIVLLILAGISINMLIGQNGILNRAGEAKSNTEDSSDLEYLQVKAYEAITNYYASSSDEPEIEYVLKNIKSTEIVADENTGTIIYKGKTYDISDVMGKTSEQKAIDEQSDVKIKPITKNTATGDDEVLFETGKIRMIIQEEKNETLRAVIPNGFYYVTGAPSTGLVISDKYGDDDNNSKSGNQFVWVPCKGKGAVTYEKTDDDSLENKFGLAAGWTKYNSHEYYYNDYKDWTDYGGNLKSVNTYGGFYVARYEAGVPSNAHFYADKDGDKYYVDEKNTTEYKPVSKKNNQVWNYVYQNTAKILGEKMYEGNKTVTSQLIDSYAWDTIVNWMEADVSGIGNDSTGYGNYANNSIKFLNSLYAVHQYSNDWINALTYKKGSSTSSNRTELATGVTISTDCTTKNNVKNIYDMAGNIWEWTTEVGNHNSTQMLLEENQIQSAKYAVLRGGSFDYSGKNGPIAVRNGNHLISNDYCVNFGFRVVLYIN